MRGTHRRGGGATTRAGRTPVTTPEDSSLPTRDAGGTPPGARFRFLVTTAAGLEPLLGEELAELGLETRALPSGALVLDGTWRDAARVMIRSRTASRLLVSLRRFSAAHQAMLYDQIRRIPWPSLFEPDRTIAVHALGTSEGTDYTTKFGALKIKDAVCDEFRKAGLPRPDVDRDDPDARITAFFFRGRCELSLDLSGDPLHRRGYRAVGAAAPLRENRAAALLRFAGYDGSGPFLDPFCGSGTIAIEAALIAMRVAPGLLRETDAFAGARLFPDLAAALEEERRAAGAERIAKPPHPVEGSDVSDEALAVARSNAVKAGAEGAVRFARKDALSVEAPGGWIVSNPPYGERLADRESAAELIREFIHRVKHHGTGVRLGLILPRGPLEHAVGLKPEKRLPVESGPLGLRFLVYEIYAGSRKRRAGEGASGARPELHRAPDRGNHRRR